MKYERCSMCNTWHCDNGSCPPEFYIFHHDYLGEEAKTVRAVDHEDAAIEYAKWYNRDEYPLMNETIEICVVDNEGNRKFFEVGAEPDIHYSSNEIKES